MPGGGEGAARARRWMAEAAGRASIAEACHLAVQAADRHRQFLADPIPAALSGRLHGGGDGHQGPPGPAGPTDLPAGLAPRPRGRVLLRRAQGAQQLPVPATGQRDGGPAGSSWPSRPTRATRPTPDDPLTAARERHRAGRAEASGDRLRGPAPGAWCAGPRRPNTGDRAELGFEPQPAGLGHGLDHRAASAPAPTAARSGCGSHPLRRGGPVLGATEVDVVVVNTHLYGATG